LADNRNAEVKLSPSISNGIHSKPTTDGPEKLHKCQLQKALHATKGPTKKTSVTSSLLIPVPKSNNPRPV
jgi:hypothetical protein